MTTTSADRHEAATLEAGVVGDRRHGTRRGRLRLRVDADGGSGETTGCGELHAQSRTRGTRRPRSTADRALAKAALLAPDDLEGGLAAVGPEGYLAQLRGARPDGPGVRELRRPRLRGWGRARNGRDARRCNGEASLLLQLRRRLPQRRGSGGDGERSRLAGVRRLLGGVHGGRRRGAADGHHRGELRHGTPPPDDVRRGRLTSARSLIGTVVVDGCRVRRQLHLRVRPGGPSGGPDPFGRGTPRSARSGSCRHAGGDRQGSAT